jgi:hypothetical protein
MRQAGFQAFFRRKVIKPLTQQTPFPAGDPTALTRVLREGASQGWGMGPSSKRQWLAQKLEFTEFSQS